MFDIIVGKRVMYTGETKYAFDVVTKALMDRNLKVGEKYTIIQFGIYVRFPEERPCYSFKEVGGYYPVDSFIGEFKEYIRIKYNLR
jgi:hypothetical protein